MSALKIALGFVPWIVFSLIATRAGAGAVGVAALLALVVAAGLVLRALARHESVKVLEATAVVTFGAMGAWALIDPASDDFLAFYGRGVAALILFAVILITLPIRPFTEQYARESVPEEYWSTPRFHSINRRISAAWAVVIGGMAVCHLIAGTIAANVAEHTGYLTSYPGELLLNWIVPGALLVGAVKYSKSVSEDAPAAQATR